MTEAFRSTDGYTITRNRRGEVVVLKPSGDKITGGGPIGACLGEYVDSLVASNDTRLGRWRWPENPDYIVYRRQNGSVIVFEESSPTAAITFWRNVTHAEVTSGAYMDAARAYFEAHPERKPWEDAKPGEVWVLTFDGAEDTFKAYESRYGTIYFTRSRETSTDLVDERITAGRRIWPEDAS